MINSEVVFQTNKGFQKLFLKNSKFSGNKTNDSLNVELEFKDRGIFTQLKSQIELFKDEISSLTLTLDKINTFQLLELWPKNFQISVYEWMLKIHPVILITF